MTKIVVQLNPHNDTWDVGWEFDDAEFCPYLCGYATKQEAEAEIPDFDERVKKDQQVFNAEVEAKEQWENQRFPNLAYVRAKIKKIKDPARYFDAADKLDWLLNYDLHEHITWPLPSWQAIKSRRLR